MKEKAIKDMSFGELIIECKKRNLAMNDMEQRDGKTWVNPNHQDSFNFGWFGEDDLRDYLNGTGRIIKGKNQKEKDLFIEHAHFLDNVHQAWVIACNHEHFDKIKPYDLKSSFSGGITRRIENPLKITKKNHEEVIAHMFWHFVETLMGDFESFGGIATKDVYDRISREYRDNSYGMIIALISLGVGFTGACNTPTIVENLSWYRDVVFAYAYHKHLTKHGVKMPDFEFVRKNRYNS